MLKIKRAIISVSEKTGIVNFASELKKHGVEIISTGGTAKLLKENSVEAIEISDYTGFPEMMDGRVKTLHPKVHGGLLALRSNPEHLEQAEKNQIKLIDMVVVNLYPFEKTIAKPDVELDEAIENIDIGGPSMLRSAAKNYKSVAVVSDPNDYPLLIEELRKNKGSLSDETLKNLGVKVFELTSAYDAAIHSYLKEKSRAHEECNGFSKNVSVHFEKLQDLRYGENSHQRAAFYKFKGDKYGLSNAQQLNGKELSFNNILDLNAAFEITSDFNEPAACFVKHNNPCGVASAEKLSEAVLNAHKCDALSAFGGIVGLNKKVDPETAQVLLDCGFLECILAPEYDLKALEMLKKKKNLRIMELGKDDFSETLDFKKVNGGLLLQEKDRKFTQGSELKVVTKKKPSKEEMESLLFADRVAKHVKSNAICLVKDTRTVGIGAGQPSRVDSVIIAVRKAGKEASGSVLASDAFFPKPDSIQNAAKAGISAIIQPGGSKADEEVIKEADSLNIAMVFSGIRHFKH